MNFIRTSGKNTDFIEYCKLLDLDLDRRIGREIQQDKYNKYNQLNEIQEAIVVYEGEKPICYRSNGLTTGCFGELSLGC